MAQWIAHRTSNPGVVGSSPTVDAIFAFSDKLAALIKVAVNKSVRRDWTGQDCIYVY